MFGGRRKGIGTFRENVILPGGETLRRWIGEGANQIARDLAPCHKRKVEIAFKLSTNLV